MHKMIYLLGFALLACGGDRATAPAPVVPDPPTSIAITEAQVVYVATGSSLTGNATVGLRNEGGTGAFYLEFWGNANSFGVQVKKGSTQTVDVLKGYSETLTYSGVPGPVSSVRAYSRPVNTAIWTLTSCYKINAGATCP